MATKKETTKQSKLELFGYDGSNIIIVKDENEALSKKQLDNLLARGYKLPK